MFQNRDELKQYVAENYVEVTDHRMDEDHWDLHCTHCKLTRGFQVIKREVSGNTVSRYSASFGAHTPRFEEILTHPLHIYFDALYVRHLSNGLCMRSNFLTIELDGKNWTVFGG